MPRIALAVPCYVSTLRPQDGRHARAVLEALGESVEVVDGRCCGQPAFNSGFRDEARAVGRELLRQAQPYETVIVPSGSCVSMVQHYLPRLFEGERAEGAAGIGARFVEFASFVARHPRFDGVAMRLEGSVAYHDSCHGRRELGITNEVLSVLARIKGLEVRRLNNEGDCCGFGGTFSVKLPEVSVAMMAAKLGDVSATGTRVLVSGDLSCLAHLEAGARGTGLRLETWTLSELLARAIEGGRQ